MSTIAPWLNQFIPVQVSGGLNQKSATLPGWHESQDQTFYGPHNAEDLGNFKSGKSKFFVLMGNWATFIELNQAPSQKLYPVLFIVPWCIPGVRCRKSASSSSFFPKAHKNLFEHHKKSLLWKSVGGNNGSTHAETLCGPVITWGLHTSVSHVEILYLFWKSITICCSIRRRDMNSHRPHTDNIWRTAEEKKAFEIKTSRVTWKREQQKAWSATTHKQINLPCHIIQTGGQRMSH